MAIAETTIPTKSEDDAEATIAKLIASTHSDPLLHVRISYPWGSGALEGRQPDDWQVEFLEEVGRQVRDRKFDGVDAVAPIRFSTASGHGIGKSALVAWLIRWILDTRPFSKGIVTANTAEQLRTKTWGELAKWHGIGMTKHWWQLNSGAGALSIYHRRHRETWRCDAQTCREENSEAFAGLHAANSSPFYIFDEASAVPDKIFEVREGGTTDGEPFIFDFGNPTRNTGYFFQNMAGKFRNRYTRRQIDSRTVSITNKELIDEWAREYGEDSDFFRVRVKGEFPRAGSLQFISLDLYDDNRLREVYVGPTEPLVYGLDVARFGDDLTVLWKRRGRDHEAYPHLAWAELDTMQVAARVAAEIDRERPDAVFIDGTGVGAGVIDRLRTLGYDVIEINNASKATLPGYANMRAQSWARMRDALKDGVRLPDHDDLRNDLIGVEYGYNAREQIQLERKEDMKKRGLASPDRADAMALTYAMPVAATARPGHVGEVHHEREYDPYD
jgi:hypothetical protein